jgi:beta-lactamase class A
MSTADATSTPNLINSVVGTETAQPTVHANGGSSTPEAMDVTTPATSPTAVEPSPTEMTRDATPDSSLTANDLPAAIDSLMDDIPAHVGMVVALPDGTDLYENEADTLFESASLYKLGIMVEVYRQRDAGDLTFDDLVTLYPGYFLEDDSVYGDADVYDKVPVGTLLSNMITLSSNVAATALLDLVGTDNVNATMASLGLDHTKILWYPVAQSRASTLSLASTRIPPIGLTGDGNPNVEGAYNITTPADIALLFQDLVNGTVISPQTSTEMLDLLSQQQINDRLPVRLPDGTRVAHKTGDLDNSVHDAGVVYAPDGPVVVVVLSDEVENRGAVVDFIQEVAQLAYQAESR